ncbi:MAG: 2-C-methyl-D-erythritol 4-phosphate cytidylyltransferase [Bacteroidetes bacterium]|nr:2-C-methyl-D-erythritol 4-phosphate cytidylyltransferase [bacterium]NBP64625.1 2-C-methyl-D-erythritol 4-phosphate cytidylyltransferase [Bacteroidota bacterium]
MPAFFIYAITEMKFTCIIPAAGKGTRFGNSIPKQFLKIDNTMIIEHAIISLINGFSTCDIHTLSIIIACDAEYESMLTELCTKHISQESFAIVRGGNTRQESIRNAIEHKLAENSDVFCIHDAVRPFIPKKVMYSLLQAINVYECVIPVLDITDTLKRTTKDVIIETIDRSQYKLAQTPQFFHADRYLESIEQVDHTSQFTDDSSMMEQLQFVVHTVEGSELMKKVTYPYDLQLAEFHATVYKDLHG